MTQSMIPAKCIKAEVTRLFCKCNVKQVQIFVVKMSGVKVKSFPGNKVQIPENLMTATKFLYFIASHLELLSEIHVRKKGFQNKPDIIQRKTRGSH